MKLLIALLACLLAAAASPRAPCPQPQAPYCAIGGRAELKLGNGIATVERIIRISPSDFPLERPLTVRFAGLASVEFRWNGVLIGRNGLPGEDKASEVPGEYFAMFVVPQRLVRSGDNVVQARLSGQHLWLPVERPVHILDVSAYETPELPGRTHYLPALLMLGAIAAACAYFIAAAIGGGPTGSVFIAGFASVVLIQLIVEVSRAFISFSYPWALGRVAAIALLACIAAVLMAAYSARRFMTRRRRVLVGGTATFACAALLLIPWFDLKAMGALLAGTIALALASLDGMRRSLAGARWALAASATILAMMLWQFTEFLDMGWYLVAAAALVLLVIEQLGQVRRARVQAVRLAALEERVAKAEAAGEPVVTLKDGSRTYRVTQDDIAFIRAADDYCEVALEDGRILLVTTGLARLVGTLPSSFSRVHKSYVVNRGHVTAIEPRPGGGRLVQLRSGHSIPVGRSYGPVVKDWAGEKEAGVVARPSLAGG